MDTYIPDLAAFEKSVTDRVPITPMLPAAVPPASPETSSTKLNDGSLRSNQAATKAADLTFSAKPSLPFPSDAPASAAANEGRRRLSGAL